MQLARLSNNSTLTQVHATQDSHYLVLPILDSTVRVLGWLVYDTQKGELVQDEPFTDLMKARQYASDLADGKNPDG